LPTVAERENAGDTIEGGAEVVPIAQLGCPSVQRHTHPQLAGLAPWLDVQCALRGQGGVERATSSGERRLEAIAGRLEDHAAITSNRPTQDGIMAGKCCAHGAGMLFPQLRAAFNIGKQEGNSSSWQVGR
jgi:hypothetical protein